MISLLSLLLAAAPARADLFKAAASDDAKAIKVLLAAGADPNARNEHGVTVLFRAAFDGHESAAIALVEGGADVDAKSGDGITPLMTAAMLGLGALNDALLARGAKPDARDTIGQNALHFAVGHGKAKPAHIAALLKAGTKPDAPGLPAGFTTLHMAANACAAGTASQLLAAGVSPDIKTRHGLTPLMQASLVRCAAVKDLLMKAGADAKLRDKDGKTAADYEKTSAKRP